MKEERPLRRESLAVVKREGRNIRLRAQPDVAFGNLQRSLQRSLDMAALGLQFGQEELPCLPELGFFPRVHLGSRLDAADLQKQYPAWVMGHTVTDIIEALEPLLTDILRICRVAMLRQRGTVGEDDVANAIHADDLGKPLGVKLDIAAAEVPGLIPEDLRDALRSLNKLRVCLTHAGGRVRDRDCNVHGALELSRVFREFWVEYESGRSEPLVHGMVTKEPGWMVMRRSREPKRFSINQQVELEIEDLVTIAMTVHELSLILRKNLYSHLRQIGWVPEDFKEPDWHLKVSAEFGITGQGEASADSAVEQD